LPEAISRRASTISLFLLSINGADPFSNWWARFDASDTNPNLVLATSNESSIVTLAMNLKSP
jgi:hypothetical protein